MAAHFNSTAKKDRRLNNRGATVSRLTVAKNNSVKKFKRKQLRSKDARQKKILQVIKASTPSTALNVDFYRSVEGIYSSYWLGKLINTLQRGGQRKVIARHVYGALTSLRYSTGANPLLIFLETLDKIKPTFRLRNYIVRRVIIKEYPIVVLRPRRLILAVHWIKEEVQAGTDKFGASLTARIATLLKDFKSNAKKNNLSKKRNEYIKRTVKAQFNIRYTFK